jgi:hypothetical protein
MDVNFYGLDITLPPDWADITDELDEDSPPTLARPDGVGALQFTISRYRGGDAPTFNPQSLQALLEAFCERNGFDCDPQTETHDNIVISKALSVAEGELISVWYVSNSLDVVLATYVSHDGGDQTSVELMEADSIIKSMTF